MSSGVFAILFVAAAASLAAWTNARYPRFAPRDLRGGMLHLGASLLACQVISPAVGSVLTGLAGTPTRLAFVLGIALPALSYAILSLIWMIALIQGAIGRGSLQ
jgi:hypothetical protein